jgi:hypothetical protein
LLLRQSTQAHAHYGHRNHQRKSHRVKTPAFPSYHNLDARALPLDVRVSLS